MQLARSDAPADALPASASAATATAHTVAFRSVRNVSWEPLVSTTLLLRSLVLRGRRIATTVGGSGHGLVRGIPDIRDVQGNP